MNTSTLYEFLWNDEVTSDYVMGVLPAQALRYVKPDYKERCYIVNTRKKTKTKNSPFTQAGLFPGHWIVLIVVHGRAVEVFDSLGQSEHWKKNDEIVSFLNRYTYYYVNDLALDSKNCGYYCLMYCYYRGRAYEPHKTVSILNAHTLYIKEYCTRLFLKNI